MSRSPAWTIERLQGMDRDSLEALYRELAPPSFEEMAGEYTAATPSFAWDDFQDLCRSSGWGTWLGKAFGPLPYGKYPGQGYNLWQPADSVKRNQRFATEIGPSLLDGRPSLMMWYTAFEHPLAALDVIDEVRKLDQGLYLCVGSPGRPVPKMAPRLGRNGRAAHEAFFLQGPIRGWIGPDDPAAERKKG